MASLLVLGGTSWLGGEVAAQAVARGWSVTCLARGAAGRAPHGVDFIRADRTETDAYAAVERRDWDAVVDVSWQPRQVTTALEALADRTGTWTYVSSCSVYRDQSTPDEDESAPLHDPLDADTATGETYGRAKARCEADVVAAMGEDRSLLARVGLIGGPGDRSDRFGYWVGRLALAGDGPVLVPDEPEQRTQVIDVRDFAAWLLDAAPGGVRGPVNVAGQTRTLVDVLAEAAVVAGFTGSFELASPAWLTAHGVEPWSGPRSLPLWLPPAEYAGMVTRDITRANRSGLSLRPMAQTLADTLVDETERGLGRARSAGLTRADELALIAELG